jgi:hypothetical protein
MVQRKDPRSRTGHPHTARDAAELTPVTRGKSRRKGIPVPEANPDWLPQARSWYNSLGLSGQAEFYEASDWATAVIAAQSYDIYLRTRNATVLANFVKLSERLGATHADRKKAGIELSDPDPADRDEEAAVASVLSWHKKFAEKHDPEPAG